MLYVSVLLASFYHSLPLSYFAYTYIHAYAHLFTLFYFIRSFSVTLPLLSLTFSLSLSLTILSHDRLCNVLANTYSTRYSVIFSDTKVVSPIANYIRSLLHLGELRASRGVFYSRRASAGPARRSARGARTIYMNHKSCNPSSDNVRFAYRCNKALRAYERRLSH